MTSSTPIHVLHVIDHLGLGGAQTAVLDMLRCRDREAFAVEVAVMHGSGPFAAELESIGVPVHSLSNAKWPPSYGPNFLRLLAARPWDVLHFHLQGANWITKPLAALAGAPVRIAHDHASGDVRFRGLPSLVPDALSHLFSTRVVAVSDGVRAFLSRWEAVPADRITVIPNGVNSETFRPASAREKSAARSRWNLPSDRFVVGAMGRLAPEKHLILLPDLAALHPEVVFVVAGSGPERSRIERRCAELGVSDRVHLLGAVSERAEFYGALDAFLLPSLFEGLPMALLEAMAAGVPVLSSRLEGIAGALSEEKEGLLARPGDLTDFSRQLSRLIENPTLGRTLAAAARNRVTTTFSAARTASAIEALYRQELAIAKPGAAGKRTV